MTETIFKHTVNIENSLDLTFFVKHRDDDLSLGDIITSDVVLAVSYSVNDSSLLQFPGTSTNTLSKKDVSSGKNITLIRTNFKD